MKRFIRDFWRDSRGQDLVEYALAAGMVAVAAVALMPNFTTMLSTVFNTVAGTVQQNMP